MSLELQDELAVLADLVSVEDAEALHEWLSRTPLARVDLSALRHLHTACLQVLMAARAPIAEWPRDTDIHAWLRAALTH
ncbi:hypothetical protein [Ectopseudomonas guguanensis]|jgi:hypothetical protein|uniref:hypothetical protein n=1 Tax=Ectopseudomonas guguanensis TaxID=1198456 RepID=UPI002863DB54|nr:hypothetical protein [Pseudomonas guguanensis]MDR8017851.1 hypothetical protein [Pseudomonas guguanensis]